MDDEAFVTWPPGYEDLRADLDALFRSNPYVRDLAPSVLEWGLGWARVVITTKPEHANLIGTVHGGVITGLADAAFEIACNAYGRRAVAIEVSCHFTVPVPAGTEIEACATEMSRGARTASYRIEVRRGEELVASLIALAYRTSRWHLGEDRWDESWRERY